MFDITQASSDWMIDMPCPFHCSPTATSCVANCTCPRSIFRLSCGHGRRNISARAGRHISSAPPALRFCPCTRSGSPTSWPWSAIDNSSRCQFLWSSVDTSRRLVVCGPFAGFSSHDVVADGIVGGAAVVNVLSRWTDTLDRRKNGGGRADEKTCQAVVCWHKFRHKALTAYDMQSPRKLHDNECSQNVCWKRRSSIFKLLRCACLLGLFLLSFRYVLLASFTFSEKHQQILIFRA